MFLNTIGTPNAGVSTVVARLHQPTLVAQLEKLSPSYVKDILKNCMYDNLLEVCQFLGLILSRNLDLVGRLKEEWYLILRYACKYSRIELVNYVSEYAMAEFGMTLRELNVSLPSVFGHETLLHVAAGRGSVNIFDYFIKRIEPTSDELKGILHACLVQSGSDTMETVERKIAILKAHFDQCFRPLLDQVEEKTGLAPLHVHNIHSKLLEYLLKNGVNLHTADYMGQTVAHKVAKFSTAGDFHEFVTLMQSMGRMNILFTTDKHQLTPVHYVLEFNRVDEDTFNRIMDFNPTLIKNSADSLIKCAIMGRQLLPILKLLTTVQTNLRVRDHLGRTYLHYAALSGHIEALRYFVECQIDVNSRCNSYQTPLHTAISNTNPQVVDTVNELLKKGADVFSKDSEGRLPEDYVKELPTEFHQETMKLLKSPTSMLCKRNFPNIESRETPCKQR